MAFAWGRSSLADTLYEIIPGFAIGLVVAVVVSLLTPRPDGAVLSEFDAARRLARGDRSEPESVTA